MYNKNFQCCCTVIFTNTYIFVIRGGQDMLQAVEAKMPRKIKMRREKEGGFMEDYYDYIFPDDEKKMGMAAQHVFLVDGSLE